LIHLDELGLLDLLSDFQAVFVPVQVWDEVERHRPEALRSAVRLRKVSVEVLTDSRLQALARTFSLDLGEQAALSLMKHQPTSVLLTDDAAARLAAKALGYRSHGTIGILLRSIRRGLCSRAQISSVLRSLPSRSTLHIRQSFRAEILRDLDSQPEVG
jgi:predicted nucleic acid-binding protein